MLVVHTTPRLARIAGGVSAYIASLVQGLVEVGTTTSVVSRWEVSREEMGLDPRIVTVEAQGRRRFRRALRDQLETRPALVHCHGIWLQYCHDSIQLARHRDLPMVVSAHGMLAPWALEYKALKKKAAWIAYQKRDLLRATLLHATAPSEVGHFRDLGLRQAVALVPPGVVVPPDGARTPRGGARTALFLGRVHPVKNLDGLLRSWAAVRPQGWRLVIAGIDPEGHRPGLERLAASLGLSGDVTFSGGIWDGAKEQLFADADIFVLPSFTENFGIVVAEALARGVPVLTTRGTPWGDLVTERCGWWIDAGQPALDSGLAVATGTDPEELVAMGARGRGLVQAKFTWDQAARSMVDAYRWQLEGGPPPPCVHTS